MIDSSNAKKKSRSGRVARTSVSHKISKTKALGFPKSSRLLRSAEFRIPNAKKWRVDGFQFYYTLFGQGRVGISISKKVLRRANARNRVRRLLKEAFRLSPLLNSSVDIHVIGVPRLAETWQDLKLSDITKHFSKLADSVLSSDVVKKNAKSESALVSE